MKARKLIALLGGVLLIALWSSISSAAPSPQERERARALMDQGDARIEAKAYEAALESYRAADQIMGVPTTALEVARTLEKLGRFVEAQDALLKVIDFPRRVDEPKPFAEARLQAKSTLSQLLPRIPRVVVKIDGLPSDVTPSVTWDRHPLAPTQLGAPLLTDAGPHELRGSADGFQTVVRSVTLNEGQKLEVVLTFARADQATAPPPTEAKGVAKAPDQPKPRASRALMWGSFGVSAVAVGVGAFAGVKSLSLTSDAKQHCTDNRCSQEADQQISDAKTWANVSNVGIAVGVVAASVGVWRWVADRRQAPAKAQQGVQLEAAVGLGRAWVGGSF